MYDFLKRLISAALSRRPAPQLRKTWPAYVAPPEAMKINQNRALKRAYLRQLQQKREEDARAVKRKWAARALLDRQTRREKSGFYVCKVPVAYLIKQERGWLTRRRRMDDGRRVVMS